MLQGLTGVTRGYRELQRDTGGLERVTIGYRGYKWLQGVTRVYRGLQRATRG